jgi:L-amino acid N-acyltransferase YncA
VVAVHTNVSVGTVSAHSEGLALHIRSMAVHPSMRGQGIGKLLLQRVEDFASANGYKRLLLNTTPFMNRAIRLYEQFGFAFNGPERDWFGTRLRTMTKQLAPGPRNGLPPCCVAASPVVLEDGSPEATTLT